MKRSVALFDFDNTIAQGDSIKRLLKYDLKKVVHIFNSSTWEAKAGESL